jgi:hypothetical protein
MDQKTFLSIPPPDKGGAKDVVEGPKRRPQYYDSDAVDRRRQNTENKPAVSRRLTVLSESFPKDEPQPFKTGDRVKNPYGRLLTVLVQLGNLVLVKEDGNQYHPRDLTMIQPSADHYQT